MNKKIRVLECIRQGQVGGGETHLLSLVENLDRSQFEPVVLSFTEGPMVEKLRSIGIPTHVIHSEKPFDISKWRKVRKLIQQENIDVVHAHGTRANSNVLWAARSLKLPVVYTVHGWSFHNDQAPVVKKIRILSEKFLTAKAQLNISVSESNRLSGKKSIPSFESVVINNGIDQVKFNPTKKFTDVRAALNIGADCKVVLFIARFTTHKQPLTLIDAFHRAFQKDRTLHLLMVGDGDEKKQALQRVATLQMERHITFQPFRSDVPDVLAAADIFVLPSLWEGLPIGLLEAMSMGKAVIGTRVDGTSEIVKHEKNGLLIDVEGMPDTLADAIERLAGDRDLRTELGNAAKETVKEKFNAAGMTREIEKEYRKLVEH